MRLIQRASVAENTFQADPKSKTDNEHQSVDDNVDAGQGRPSASSPLKRRGSLNVLARRGSPMTMRAIDKPEEVETRSRQYEQKSYRAAQKAVNPEQQPNYMLMPKSKDKPTL